MTLDDESQQEGEISASRGKVLDFFWEIKTSKYFQVVNIYKKFLMKSKSVVMFIYFKLSPPLHGKLVQLCNPWVNSN